jgi:hypothetical protein
MKHIRLEIIEVTIKVGLMTFRKLSQTQPNYFINSKREE